MPRTDDDYVVPASNGIVHNAELLQGWSTARPGLQNAAVTSGPAVPTHGPIPIAADTWLIPNLAPAGDNVFLPVNSMLIRGEQPVIVDTGAPISRAHWLEQVFSLVDPEDVRWIYLSHDDGDHMGGLFAAMDMCPRATLITNYFAAERIGLDGHHFPPGRMAWLGPGDTLRLPDRNLRLVLPPIFDGPATRALFDDATEVLWAVDSFAALTPGPVHRVAELPPDLYDESFALLNSLISPWHQFLDPARYNHHVDTIQNLSPRVVASSHGPLLTEGAICTAFGRVRRMAGQPIVAPPGQPLLDELVRKAAG